VAYYYWYSGRAGTYAMFQYVGRYMMSRGGLDTSYVVDVVVCAKPPLRTGALPVYRVEYQRFRFSFNTTLNTTTTAITIYHTTTQLIFLPSPRSVV